MTLVLDASVAVKLVIEEPGSEAASAAAAESQALVAPGLILVEAANALRRKALAGELSAEEALAAFEDLVAIPMLRVDDDALVREALELALLLHHPVADCLYLALSLRADAELLTADRIFADVVRRHEAYAERCRLLGE